MSVLFKVLYYVAAWCVLIWNAYMAIKTYKSNHDLVCAIDMAAVVAMAIVISKGF